MAVGEAMMSVGEFYDALADDYHLLFIDWEAAVVGQSGLLEGLLRPLLGAGPWSLLDATSGVGTQALGLAQRGHRVHANDLSAGAVARLRREAEARGVRLATSTLDVRAIDRGIGATFDGVLCVDNSLPHLLTDADLTAACTALRGCLRPGGWALLTIRDYDEILAGAPRGTTSTPVRVLGDARGRRMVYQVWDWAVDGESYAVTQFIVRGEAGAEAWTVRGVRTTYRALRRATLTAALEAAGFVAIEWRMPEGTGFYQPLVLAQAPADPA